MFLTDIMPLLRLESRGHSGGEARVQYASSASSMAGMSDADGLTVT